MPSHRDIAASIDSAIEAVLRQQSADGFWRDFDVPIGRSEAWTTALVGWCLTPWLAQREVRIALLRARPALLSASGPGGWGYHRMTTPDADSTAWVLRCLGILAPAVAVAGRDKLERFVDAGGRAHTFLEPLAGEWGSAHPDVTPVVGLALLASRASPFLLRTVRQAVLEDFCNPAQRRAYWWQSETYAMAWQLRFLARSGGIPNRVGRTAVDAMRVARTDRDPFEVSHTLLALAALGESRGLSDILIEQLLVTQTGTGLWAGSAPLLVPVAEPSASGNTRGPYHDFGTVTTALALFSLHTWIRGYVSNSAHSRLSIV